MGKKVGATLAAVVIVGGIFGISYFRPWRPRESVSPVGETSPTVEVGPPIAEQIKPGPKALAVFSFTPGEGIIFPIEEADKFDVLLRNAFSGSEQFTLVSEARVQGALADLVNFSGVVTGSELGAELGPVVEADLVVVGTLEQASPEYVASLECFDVPDGDLVLARVISGATETALGEEIARYRQDLADAPLGRDRTPSEE